MLPFPLDLSLLSHQWTFHPDETRISGCAGMSQIDERDSRSRGIFFDAEKKLTHANMIVGRKMLGFDLAKIILHGISLSRYPYHSATSHHAAYDEKNRKDQGIFR
jgi:hypothetical protein